MIQRLWRPAVLSLALVLVSVLFGPARQVSANDYTQAQTEAILARITHAPNLDRAFLALSKTEQGAVVRYLTPIKVVTAKTPWTTTSTSGGHLASLSLSAGCDTAHNWIRALNAFGVTMYQYDNQVSWCYDGTYVTSHWAEISWASNVAPGWNYNGEIARYTTGGTGQVNFTLYTKGQFSLCIGWCQQTQFPWLNTLVGGSGGTGLSGGIQ